jgi:hypothetical protein
MSKEVETAINEKLLELCQQFMNNQDFRVGGRHWDHLAAGG